MTTKGEVLIAGLNQIRDGLEMISRLGDKTDLVKTMVGSQAAARRLRDVMKDNNVVYNMVLNMVQSRNGQLSPKTVTKVINDFLDVLFDLSQPYTVDEQTDNTSIEQLDEKEVQN